MRRSRLGLGWRATSVFARCAGAVVIVSAVGVLHGTAGSVWSPVAGAGTRALLLAGSALVLVAGGLERRMAVAAFVSCALSAAGIAGALTGSRQLGAVAVLFAGVVLVITVDDMVWPTRERAVSTTRFGAAVLLLLLSVGLVTILLSGGSREGRSLPTDVREAARLLTGDRVARSGSAVGRAVEAGLPLAAGLTGLVVLELLVSGSSEVPESDAEVRCRVASLCASAAGDSLAPFTVRKDRSFALSADGRAVIGFRVVFGVCVAGPGPVGEADSHAEALAAWIHRCDANGWRPAMIGASDVARQLAANVGLHAIGIGDEAIVPVGAFRLDQPSMRNVRQAVQRTRNAGVVVTIHREGALDRRTRDDLLGVVADWQHGSGELGFAMTMDGLLDGSYPDALIVVAHHRDRAVGFQRYFLARGDRTLSLDVMPRRHDAPNGVNERLIAEALAWSAANDVDELSLNFAAFRSLFEATPTAARRMMRWGVHRLDPFINVESLYRFNAKFQPRWVPRHVLYRSPLDLPFVLCAALWLEFRQHGPARHRRSAVHDATARPPASAALT